MTYGIRFFLLLILLGNSLYSPAQYNYASNSGSMHFTSRSSVGEIEGISNTVAASFDVAEKQLLIQVAIRSFSFDKALMQQYFNEKYMESNRFPKATFEGLIDQNLDLNKNNTYAVTVTGRLNIHGVSRKKTINGVLTVLNKKITVTSTFAILSADYNIKSPDKIYEKVGEKVEITFKANLTPEIQPTKK